MKRTYIEPLGMTSISEHFLSFDTIMEERLRSLLYYFNSDIEKASKLGLNSLYILGLKDGCEYAKQRLVYERRAVLELEWLNSKELSLGTRFRNWWTVNIRLRFQKKEKM